MDRSRNSVGSTRRPGGSLYFRIGALQLGRLRSSNGLLHDYGIGLVHPSPRRREPVTPQQTAKSFAKAGSSRRLWSWEGVKRQKQSREQSPTLKLPTR